MQFYVCDMGVWVQDEFEGIEEQREKIRAGAGLGAYELEFAPLLVCIHVER